MSDNDQKSLNQSWPSDDKIPSLTLEERFKFAQTVLENTTDAVFWMETNGKFLDCNLAACKMLGYSRAELLVMGVADIDPSLSNGVPPEMAAATKAQGFGHVETTHQRKDRTIFPCELLVIYVEYGEKAFHCAFSRDISERKKTEMELVSQKNRAEDSTHLKDKFVSLVAHDLKSPFNSILGFLQMVIDDDQGSLGSEQRHQLELAIKSGLNLVEMIDSLLDINRLQSGRILPEMIHFNIAPLIDSVIGSMNFIAQHKGIIVENKLPKEGLYLHTDKGLYREVLQNLISNALKFCRRGDKIEVFASENSKGSIVVKDTGPGIDPLILKDLFRYEVKTSTTGSAGEIGTGLGLPYAMDIMKSLGGDILAQSNPGQGAEFSIRLL